MKYIKFFPTFVKNKKVKEDFLHYVWQYKKFDVSNLTTVSGDTLTILNSGNYLQMTGPDFFNAQIILNNQRWAGTIEIHCNSSDWYVHNHEIDPNYENVILHVVWEHDLPVFRKDNTEVPVLELKHIIPTTVLENYKMLSSRKSWIFCENQIAKLDTFVLLNWFERLYFERLERKLVPIERWLKETENDWEAVLFFLLAKNFGLNTNGDTFLNIAKSIPFTVVRKECQEVANIESLFFGFAHLIPLNPEDTYSKDQKSRFEYLKSKHQLTNEIIEPVQFFKHRPSNFPTIRLAQLAMLYHKQHHLFSKLIAVETLSEVYKLFQITSSSYWLSHYHFEKTSPKKKSGISKNFIDLLVVNTIIPLQFAYAKSQGIAISRTLLNLICEVVAEKNSIVDRFSNFGITAKNALESQAVLELKNEYCNYGKCLNCAIGIHLLKE